MPTAAFFWRICPGRVTWTVPAPKMQPPSQRKQCTLCSLQHSSQPRQSWFLPQHFYLLLHKWPGYIKTMITVCPSLLQSTFCPQRAWLLCFTLKKHLCCLQSKWHWGEDPYAKSHIVLNQDPMRKHSIRYCPYLELEKCELCSKKRQTGFKLKQCCFLVFVLHLRHFRALGQVVRPLWSSTFS